MAAGRVEECESKGSVSRTRCKSHERKVPDRWGNTSKRSFSWILLVLFLPNIRSQQQDPTTLNGGSVLAMAGKDCVALAVDKRFGSGPALINVQPRSVLVPTPHVLVAFTGLDGDVQSLQEELLAQVSLKYSRGLGFGSPSTLSPRAMTSLTSHVMYARRQAPYYVEPMVVGLEAVVSELLDPEESRSEMKMMNIRYRPFLCSMDIIGAKSTSAAFVCGGAATQSLYGTAEALWKPELEANDLVDVCGKAFLSALERDCLSGYGASVYLVTADGITEYDLASRND